MFKFPFCLYNDEPFLFSENGAQELRDLVDAPKIWRLQYNLLFCLSNFYFKKYYL